MIARTAHRNSGLELLPQYIAPTRLQSYGGVHDIARSRMDSLEIDHLVSVLIPTYNRSALLRCAVDSVLAQSYKRLQVVVVDDGSTDDTAANMKKLAQRDPRVLHCPNRYDKGSAGARKTGLEEVKGNLIAFLDDDDEYLPAKIAYERDVFLANPEVDVVVSGVHSAWCSEGKQGSDWVALEFHPHQLFQACAVMCKREVLERIDVRWGNMEWRDLAFQVYEAGFTVWFSCQKLFRVHRTPGSLGTHSLARYKIALENAKRYYERSRGREDHAVFERYLAICYKNIGNMSLKQGMPWKAMCAVVNSYRVGKRVSDLVPFT